MQFTKSQVIALFLASTSAVDVDVTPTEIINSNCSADTVAAGTPGQALEACSSMTSCTLNTGCSGASEVCGTFVAQGADALNLTSNCMQSTACKMLGKTNGVAFAVECTTLGGPPSSNLPVPDTLLAAVEAIVTPPTASGTPTTWSAVKNLKVPALYNFQSGWWIRDSNETAVGIYTETNTQTNNACADNDGCTTSGECCAAWPDYNHKRCINSALGGVEQTIAPFSAFTPTCIAATGGVPVSGLADLKEEKQAKAAEDIKNYDDADAAKAKTDAGYDAMTDEKKAEYDTKVAKEATDAATALAAERTLAGYDTMTAEQKTIFDSVLLQSKKDIKAACDADAKSIACINGAELRKKEESDRKADGYYTQNADSRAAFDSEQEERNKTEKATLTAAWKTANKPKDGEPGSSCSKTEKCSNKAHCCGTGKPKLAGEKEVTGVCADKMTKKFTDGLGFEYDHTCAAQRLLAAAGAVLAATYLM